MEIMGESKAQAPAPVSDDKASGPDREPDAGGDAAPGVDSGTDAESDAAFSEENIGRETPSGGGGPAITPADKAAFIEAVVENKRFTKDYSLFGGRMRLTCRSLTADEVNALAAWTSRIGTDDGAGLVAGRYRKYVLAAQVAMLDGVEMPPLEQPLFCRLGADGKTVEPPGWTKRCDYWDGVGYGTFTAALSCIAKFDALYAALCAKAEDENFWLPGTP